MSFPVAETVWQGKRHSYLARVKTRKEQLRRNIGNLDDLEGEVEELFLQIQRQLAELRVEFIHKSREFKAISEALISAAYREIH